MFRHVHIHCMLQKVPAPFLNLTHLQINPQWIWIMHIRKQKNWVDSLCGCGFIKVHLLQISINCHRTACGRIQVFHPFILYTSWPIHNDPLTVDTEIFPHVLINSRQIWRFMNRIVISYTWQATPMFPACGLFHSHHLLHAPVPLTRTIKHCHLLKGSLLKLIRLFCILWVHWDWILLRLFPFFI